MEDSKVLFADIPQLPEDPMFGLSAAYRADTHPQKVDLGVGAYRDDNAKPWILPSVKRATAAVLERSAHNHEYLPIAGLDTFLRGSQTLLFGTSSSALTSNRIATVQTLSGTGALHLGALLLSRFVPDSATQTVHASNPPYVNHLPILQHAGLPTELYPYYSASTRGLDIDSLLFHLSNIPTNSTVLLHACGHNPTGVDPTPFQWKQIAQVMKYKSHVPFFDIAYQGFVSGDPDADAWPIRHFVDAGFETILIAQSFAKNFGMYGERVGTLHVVCATPEIATNVTGQLKKLQRVEISTPPAFGARIVGQILSDPGLFGEWKTDVRTMAERIMAMRKELRRLFEEGGAKGDWGHLTGQSGMFCYSGLAEWQVEALRSEWHVYTTRDGRMSIAGLNWGNVEYVARAVASVVREKGEGFQERL